MPVTQYNFPSEYRDLCFTIWYKSQKPSMKQLHALVPESNGNRPSQVALQKWREADAWDTRAEEIQLAVRDKLAAELIRDRALMLKEQAEQAAIIRNEAFEYLTTTGFDSSTSAVQAIKWAVEAEQKARGIEQALTNLGSASEEQLKREFMRLVEGASDLGVIDGEELEEE